MSRSAWIASTALLVAQVAFAQPLTYLEARFDVKER